MKMSSSNDNNQDFTALSNAYRLVLTIVVQNAFYSSPSEEQILTVRTFLNRAQSHILAHQSKGMHQRHVNFLTEFYNEADDMLKRVARGEIKRGAENESVVKLKSGEVTVKQFMTNTVNSLYTFIIRPDRMPTVEKITSDKRDVSNIAMVDKLKKLLGTSLFEKYPNASWESSSGTAEQGTLLELRGVSIPEGSLEWFRKRLNGHCRFEFIPCKTDRKLNILRILDAEGQLEREARDKILSDPKLPERKAKLESTLQQQGLNVDLTNKKGWSLVLAKVIIEGKLEHHGLEFTDEMQQRLVEMIIEQFDALYSSGTKFRELPPNQLNQILLDIQHQYLAEFQQKPKVK